MHLCKFSIYYMKKGVVNGTLMCLLQLLVNE